MTELMLENFEYMKYTYLHRKAFKAVIDALPFSGFASELINERAQTHDMDKVVMYTVLSKKEASRLHREHSQRHMGNGVEKFKIDYLEAVIDWECAGLTKADKPLNAYDTLMKYYPEHTDRILPILRYYNMAYSYDVRDRYKFEAFEVTEEMVMQDINNYLKGAVV